MLTAGDEFGRTQNGNNNAYCQDNELSWLSWQRDPEAQRLEDFTSCLVGLRRAHPIFRRPKFFQGRKIRGSEIKDIMWFTPLGREMSDEEWRYDYIRCLAMLLSGDTMDVRDPHGEVIHDDTFLLLLNAHFEAVNFTLPGLRDVEWELILDTRTDTGCIEPGPVLRAGTALELIDRSLCLLRLHTGSQSHARSEPGRMGSGITS